MTNENSNEWLTDEKIDALTNTPARPEDIERLETMMHTSDATVPATVLGIMYKKGLVYGVADADKAFYYLSIGMYGRGAEAVMHLSEYYYDGIAVPENKPLAMNWIHDMYTDFRNLFAAGEMLTPFVDVAYRWARMLYRSAGDVEGEDVLVDKYNAYACLLEADFALARQAPQSPRKLTDQAHAKAIAAFRTDLSAELGIKVPENWPAVTGGNYMFMFEHLHDDGYRALMTFKKHGDEMTISGKRLNRFTQTAPPVLVTVSDLNYCGFMTEVTMMTEGLSHFAFSELSKQDDFELSIVTDTMETDVDDSWQGTITFFNEGEAVARVRAARYVVATAPFKDRQVPPATDIL